MTWINVLIASLSAFAGGAVGAYMVRPKLPAPPYRAPMNTRPPTFTEIVPPPVGDSPIERP